MGLVNKTYALPRCLHTWTRNYLQCQAQLNFSSTYIATFTPPLCYHYRPMSTNCKIRKNTVFAWIIQHSVYLNSKRSNFTAPEFHPPEEPEITAIVFTQEENKNAEQFFRKSPLYKNLMFHPLPTPSQKLHPSVEKLMEIAKSPENTKLPVASPLNKPIMDKVIQDLKELKDPDLLQVIYHLRFFALSPSIKDPGYHPVWTALDEECSARMSTWPLDFLFTVADLWSGLYLARHSAFHWTLLKRCFRKVERLTKEQFVRFLFCLNLNRRLPDSMNTYELEYFLKKVVDKLSPQEVAIVAMAFFKTQTILHDKQILHRLLEIVMVGVKTLNSIDVAAVAKFTRMVSNPKARDVVIQLQETFLPELERLSIPACTHLALVGTSTQSPHLELVNGTVKKMLKSVQEARLKELERISLAMTMFNADCDELCHQIVDELRSPERAEELRTYGRCLPAILHYLSIREIFPTDLISMALAERFRNQYYGVKWETYQRELLCLDFAAELEIPDYKGERLDLKTRKRLCRINFQRIAPSYKTRLSAAERTLKIIVQVMEASLGGTDLVYPCNILPQHSSIGAVFCTDDEGGVVNVPDNFRQIKEFEISYIPEGTTNINYNVILPCSENMALRTSGSVLELSGQARLQVRQLKKMGYRVHTVAAAGMNQESIKFEVNKILSMSKPPNVFEKNVETSELNIV